MATEDCPTSSVLGEAGGSGAVHLLLGSGVEVWPSAGITTTQVGTCKDEFS